VLLVAGTQIRDPRFMESVILLLSAGPGGAMGLIINKPTATKVSSGFGGTGSMSRGGDPLFYGGPVGGHGLLMLRRADRAPADWVAVVHGVFVTNSRMAMMDALMAARMAEEVRVYAGYAGWGAGQLEREIERGDWYLLPADAALIFRRDMTKLWPELFRKSREIVL
jgi:putative transcriptional regulator